jgi:hypothetical protein
MLPLAGSKSNFRFTPESRLNSEIGACPKCARSGRFTIAHSKNGLPQRVFLSFSSRLRHAARYEAADRSLAIYEPRPDHRSTIAVRPGDHGIVRNVDPFVVEMNAVMAVFGIPVRIGYRTAIYESAAQPVTARQMIEPAIELGMVGVVGKHGSAEQQQNQSQSLHHYASSRFLFVMETTLGLQASGVLLWEDALVYRASLSNEKNAFEITLRDKLNDFAHVRSEAGNSRRCHDEDHAIPP